MTKLVFILYVGCVLMFSAFARATEMRMPFVTTASVQTPAHIEGVGVDQVNLELLITGYLSNPCVALPSASLTADINSPNTLVLRLSSPLPTKNCVSMTKDFNTVVNLPVLAQNSAISIEDKAVYLIKLEGYEFEMQVLGSELMRVPGFISQ